MSHLTDDLLNEYLDDALPARSRAEVEAHLAGCAACRAEVAALRGLAAALGDLPAPALPADLTRAVLGEIAPAQRGWPLRAWATLAAQVVAALILAAWLAPALQSGGAPLSAAWGAVAAAAAEIASARPMSADLVARAAERALDWHIPAPIAALGARDWLAAIAAAAAIWLVGSGLLLRLPAQHHEERLEAHR